MADHDRETPGRERSFRLMRKIVEMQWRQGEKWIRDRGVSIEQGHILGYLLDHPGAIQRDIAQATDRTEANVSALLQKMEKRVLVERRTESGDDRSKRVHATGQGRDIIAGLNEAMAGIDEVILAPLSAGERRTLEALLDRIVTGLPGHW